MTCTRKAKLVGSGGACVGRSATSGLQKYRTTALIVDDRIFLNGSQGVGVSVTIPVAKLLLAGVVEDHEDLAVRVKLNDEILDRTIEHAEGVLKAITKECRLLANECSQAVDKVSGTLVKSRQRRLHGFKLPYALLAPGARAWNLSRIDRHRSESATMPALIWVKVSRDRC